MSPSIAAKAERGAHELVDTAERMLQEMGVKPGPNTLFSVTNSVYYLPIVLGYSAKPVETIRELNEVLKQARALLPTDPALAALLASETIETLCAIRGALAQPGDEASGPLGITNPISDAQVRSWGVQLADGRMPGIALIMGSASNNAVNAILIEELRQHHILCLLSGHGLPDQLQEEGVGLGDRAYIIPLGSEPSSAAHALGFAARCAMKLGGHKPGAWDEILQYGKRRTPGFVLALGELDDRSWAVALAAQSFGFSLITDGRVPGTDTSHSRLFEPIAGEDDRQTAMRLAEECISARGLKLRQYKVSLPVGYSPAFEDEVIGNADLRIQFGGKGVSAFELLQIAAPDALPDGKVDVVGPELAELAGPGPVEFGLVVMAAGKKLEADFEAYLERQMHTFLNYASGIQHSGGKDAISIRISKAAAAHGLTFQSLGRLLHTRFHEEFPDAIEKLQVLIITDGRSQAEWRAKAHDVHQLRLQRLASLTDNDVDEFYVCTNCRTFAPSNVSIISPERVSPCGKSSWLDAKASYTLNPAGARRPIKVGKALDPAKGIWEGTNKYAKTTTHGRISEVALYSIMHTPMSACGDFECMVVLIPEANGVMVVSHDDTSLTPAGITIDTFSSVAAGEQIPGVVGIGKSHLLSPRFIAAEGGFKRVVWMSSTLKESLSEELKAVCTREGDPDLMDKIADERQVATVEQLISWLKEHRHPALEMERMF